VTLDASWNQRVKMKELGVMWVGEVGGNPLGIVAALRDTGRDRM
jgi:hypothetical protein